MKILIVQPRIAYYAGGGESYPLQQAFWFARHGHEVTILTFSTNNFSPQFEAFQNKNTGSKKITVIEIDRPERYREALDSEPGIDWFRWNLESSIFGRLTAPIISGMRGDIDVISTHMSTDSLFIPEKISNVLHLHGSPLEKTDLIRLSTARADGFVFVSDQVQKFWEQFMEPPRPFITSKNAVDTEWFVPGMEERVIDVLFVGRFIQNKGIDDLVHALLPSHNAVFIGTGPLLPKIKHMVDAEGKNVKFIQRASAEDLRHYYRKSKLLACPSTGKEGVLTTMLEAAACKCAIITTSGSSMTEFAIDQKNALIVAPRSPEALRSAITTLLLDEKLRSNLAEASQRKVEKFWSWEYRITELENFYGLFV